MSFNELNGLSIEISVLATPVPVKNAQETVYGTHGVIVTQGKEAGFSYLMFLKNSRQKKNFYQSYVPKRLVYQGIIGKIPKLKLRYLQYK